MHWLGLEEEFLGVAEKRQELHTMMNREGSDAASRHCSARFAGCVCLCVGSLLVISPITSLLTGNWLVAALGGALLSAFITCIAMLCCFGCFVCMYWGMVNAHEHAQSNGEPPQNQGYFL